MSSLFLHCEGNDTYGVDDTADEREEEQGQIFTQHMGQENQTAPAQHNKKRDMKRFGTAGAENSDENDACDDNCPLNAAEDCTQLISPEEQPQGSECTADQQIDGNIIEPPPDALDGGAPAEGVIQAAHEEHHDQAETIDN